MRCSFFDQSCDFLWPRDVDRVTGARDFDFVALGSLGIPPLQVWIDGSVISRYQHPAWSASPGRCRDHSLEVVSGVEHLRSCHEGGLLSRKIGGEVFVKLRQVEVRETVGG